MSGPLLATKLHVPRRGRGHVVRPRLDALLESGRDATLTLVSAPAGFGKTTLLAEWLTTAGADGVSVAWVSLDGRDSSRRVLVIRGRCAAAVADHRSARVRSRFWKGPSRPIEAVTDTLLNDINACRRRSCWCSTTIT